MISEKANDLLNKFGSAQFDFMVWNTPDNLVARDKARQEISDYIAELEGAGCKHGELDFPAAEIATHDDYMNWNREELIGEIKRLAEVIQLYAENEVTFVKKILALNNKVANLHKVISKLQTKVARQKENITTLLHLYTSGKRSKSHKKLREKYRALKARMSADVAPATDDNKRRRGEKMSEKFKKALRVAVNVGGGFEGDAEDAAELLTLITGLESRIAELEGVIEIFEDQQRETKNILIDKNLHIDSLYEDGYKLQQRIAEPEKLENLDFGGKFAEITFKTGRTVGFFLSRVPYGEWRLWDASTRFCLDSDDLHVIVDKLDELNKKVQQ